MVPARLHDALRAARHSAAGARRVGDLRRPPEVPANHEQHTLVQTAIMQVLDENRDRSIEKKGALADRMVGTDPMAPPNPATRAA